MVFYKKLPIFKIQVQEHSRELFPNNYYVIFKFTLTGNKFNTHTYLFIRAWKKRQKFTTIKFQKRFISYYTFLQTLVKDKIPT